MIEADGAQDLRGGGKLIDGAKRVVSDQLSGLNDLQRKYLGSLTSASSLLRIATLTGVLLSAGCGNLDVPTGISNKLILQGVSAEPTKTPMPDLIPSPTEIRPASTSTPHPTATARPIPKETATPTLRTEFHGNVTVVYSKENMPIKIIMRDKKEITLNLAEMEQVRQKALSSKEPEVYSVTKIVEPKPTPKEYLGTTEHPRVKELPKDVVTDEELKKRGIRIIQSTNTDLSIRKGAFEKDGPLADYGIDAGHKLSIVLVNGPSVSTNLMSDKRYDEVRPILQRSQDKDIAAYKKANIELLSQGADSVRKKIQAEIEAGKDPSGYEDLLLAYKSRLLQYEKLLSDDEILSEMSIDQYRAAGLYAYGGENNGKTTETVFVATGEIRMPEGVEIAFDSRGKAIIRRYQIINPGGLTPLASQSHPDPASFHRSPNASKDDPTSYPYRAQTVGNTLRHELKHAELINRPTRRLKQENFRNSDGSLDFIGFLKARRGNNSEYDTDEGAMEDIRSAWNKWKDSGFKDDSGYCFVFSVPEGGFMLTDIVPSIESKLL